jgi:preprotein translocase subunit SecA
MMDMRLRQARTIRRSSQPSRAAAQNVAALVAVAYELLDAHADTARLVGNHAIDAEWRIHLAYLRDLQRVGREALAQADPARPR